MRRLPTITDRFDDRSVSSPALAWSLAVVAGYAPPDPLAVARLIAGREFLSRGAFAMHVAAWSRLTGHPVSDLPEDLRAVVPGLVVRSTDELAQRLQQAAAVRDTGEIEGILEIEGPGILLECSLSDASATRWLATVDALEAAFGDAVPARVRLFRVDVLSAGRRRAEAAAEIDSALAGASPPDLRALAIRACRLGPDECARFLSAHAKDDVVVAREAALPR
jgi:hypothetical protein